MKKIAHSILAVAFLYLNVVAPASAAFRAFGTTSIQAGDTVANTGSVSVLTTRLLVGPSDPSGSNGGSTDVRQGMQFHIYAYCTIGTKASAQGTLKIDVDWQNGNGGVTLTNLGTTGAFTPPASLAANTNALYVDGMVTFNTTGTSAVATFFGHTWISGASNVPTDYPMLPATMASGGTSGWATSFNLTVDRVNGPVIVVTWGTGDPANTITCAMQTIRVA